MKFKVGDTVVYIPDGTIWNITEIPSSYDNDYITIFPVSKHLLEQNGVSLPEDLRLFTKLEEALK